MSGADDLDQATELTQMMNDSAVLKVQKLAQPEQVRNADGTWPHAECVDCSDDIVMARLQMGKTRCVICQSKLERRRAGL